MSLYECLRCVCVCLSLSLFAELVVASDMDCTFHPRIGKTAFTIDTIFLCSYCCMLWNDTFTCSLSTCFTRLSLLHKGTCVHTQTHTPHGSECMYENCAFMLAGCESALCNMCSYCMVCIVWLKQCLAPVWWLSSICHLAPEGGL